MSESEKTRITDAEVEAAANAIWPPYPPPRYRDRVYADARAALEAAAALRQPREGAENG